MSVSAGARDDLKRLGAWLGDLRVLLAVLLAIVVAAALVTVFGGRVESAPPALAPASYGGDDAYDPAAGSMLARWSRIAGPANIAGYSGDDLYDPATGARPAFALRSAPPALAPASYGGDDPYDPAAGSRPALYSHPPSAGYSGDDAYDPAAGGGAP
jgi:hypothetical protein